MPFWKKKKNTPFSVIIVVLDITFYMGGKRSYHDLKFQKSLTTSFLDREKKKKKIR